MYDLKDWHACFKKIPYLKSQNAILDIFMSLNILFVILGLLYQCNCSQEVRESRASINVEWDAS